MEPTAVVREYVAAQNRGDIERMLALVADRVEMRTGLSLPTMTQSTISENKTQLRRRFAQIARQAPQARTEITEVMTQGGVVITKERMTRLPDGTGSGIALYNVRAGKIESIWLISAEASGGN